MPDLRDGHTQDGAEVTVVRVVSEITANSLLSSLRVLSTFVDFAVSILAALVGVGVVISVVTTGDWQSALPLVALVALGAVTGALLAGAYYWYFVARARSTVRLLKQEMRRMILATLEASPLNPMASGERRDLES